MAGREWCVAVVVAVFLGVAVGPAEAQGVSTLKWQAPALFDSQPNGDGPSTVTCPSVSFCAAGDNAGQVLTTTDPSAGAQAWSASLVGTGDAPYGFFGLSCPTVSLCVGVDNVSAAAVSTNPTAGPAAWQKFYLPNPVGWATGVSCPSTSLCVAVTENGSIDTSGNPAGGTAAWTSAYVDTSSMVFPGFRSGQASFDSVSCPSVSLCIATDGAGNVFTSHDPTGGPSAWAMVHLGVGGPLSCPAVSLCVAGAGAGVITSQNPSGSASAWKLARLDRGFGLEGISCPSVSFCAAVDNGGRVLTSLDPAGGSGAWTVASIGLGTPPSPDGFSISCASSSLCLVVDRVGHVVVGLAKPDAVIREEVRALLAGELAPAGKLVQIPSLLHHAGEELPFNAPMSGGVVIEWLAPALRQHSGRLPSKPVVVASGSGRFPAPGTATVKLTLARAELALLTHATRPRITARAVFTPDGATPIIATDTFALRR